MYKAVEIATAEIGTKAEGHEIKYYSEILPDERRFKPWCVPFIEWVFTKAYGKTKALKMLCLKEYTQSVHDLVGAFRDNGKWHRHYTSCGWLMFLRSEEHKRINHVELIVQAAHGKFITIGGNCNGAVAQNTFEVGDKRIVGYGGIDYEEVLDNSIKVPIVKLNIPY